MTEQQRRTIRAELARAMGWTINEMRLGHFCLIAPDGSYRDCFHSEPEDVWECERLPDPFTNTADKDALVEALKQIGELPRYDDNSILEAQRIAGAAIAAAESEAAND